MPPLAHGGGELFPADVQLLGPVADLIIVFLHVDAGPVCSAPDAALQAGGCSCCSVKFCGGAVKSIPGILQLFGGLPDLSRRRGRGRQRFKRRFDSLQLVLAEILEAKHLVPCVLVGADKFVEFELYGGGVAVLGVLKQEYHQEGDDGRARIDDQHDGRMNTLARPHCRPVQ
jgi:hypothetical protein